MHPYTDEKKRQWKVILVTCSVYLTHSKYGWMQVHQRKNCWWVLLNTEGEWRYPLKRTEFTALQKMVRYLNKERGNIGWVDYSYFIYQHPVNIFDSKCMTFMFKVFLLGHTHNKMVSGVTWKFFKHLINLTFDTVTIQFFSFFIILPLANKIIHELSLVKIFCFCYAWRLRWLFIKLAISLCAAFIFFIFQSLI